MPSDIDRHEVRRLPDEEDAQLVHVLPLLGVLELERAYGAIRGGTS